MTKTMIIRIFFLIPLLIAGFPAAAQTNEAQIPTSREQVQLSFAPVVKRVSPAVVNIYTKRVVERAYNPFASDPFFSRFFGNGAFGNRIRREAENSLGSGVIINEDGMIVTNAHVIKGATEITAVLNDGRELSAEVALTDEASDLALLRTDTQGKQLPYVTLKPSESLEVGDLVLAIGNPFGVGQTVTSGIVSARGTSSLNINDFNFFIQTDAAINPGNSGGPLVALDGGVVGINSAIYSRDGGSLGIGFAVPSEMVLSLLAAEKSGRAGDEGVIRPWLGMGAQAVTNDIGESLALDAPRGAMITELHSASPLKASGMKIGDVIVKVNDWEIRDPSEMKFRMSTIPIGETVKMTVWRNGKNTVYDVEAIVPPETPPREKTKLSGAHILNGASIVNVNPAVAMELGIFGEEGGVAVYEAPRGTQSARVVKPGDVLLNINGTDVKSVYDVKKALSKPANAYALTIKSNGQIKQIQVR